MTRRSSASTFEICPWKNKKPSAYESTTLGFEMEKYDLQIGVTGAEHGGETGHFHLAAAAFARLLIVTMVPDFTKGSLAVDSFLEPTQGFFHRFTFL